MTRMMLSPDPEMVPEAVTEPHPSREESVRLADTDPRQPLLGPTVVEVLRTRGTIDGWEG